MRMRTLTRPVLGALVLAALVPLLVVASAPLHTIATEWPHVFGELLPPYLMETLALVSFTLALAIPIGVGTAWLVASFEFPLRGMFSWALALPLACPTYIAAYAYAALLGPTGSWSVWLNEHLGLRPDIMHLPGLALVMALVLYPYIYLAARAAFVAGMTDRLDAARMLGAHPASRFFRVALPMARPAIAGGAVLVAMEALNDYGAVKHYGIRTLTTGIFRSWGGLHDMGSALRLGLVLLLLVALLLWIERRARGRARQEAQQAPVARQRLHRRHAAWAIALLSIVSFGALIIPCGHLLIDALATRSHWPMARLVTATTGSLVIATIAAAGTLLSALALLFAHRQKLLPAPLIRAANLGYVIPGAVIATGVMTVAGAVDRSFLLPFTLIGGTGLLCYALCVRFLAVAGQPLQGALKQQATALDDSARMLGASPLRTFLRVNLPLLRPALLAAAMLVAMDVVKELPLTMILRPFNMDTLSTLTFEMVRIEQLREAAPPALLIVLCATLPVLVLDRLAQRIVR